VGCCATSVAPLVSVNARLYLTDRWFANASKMKTDGGNFMTRPTAVDIRLIRI
jgi:hypothetical protein